MKAVIQPRTHASYQKHRKDVASKIILPVVLAALVFVGMIVLITVLTFQGNGDVNRWAAISTIFIAIPVMVGGLIAVILLGAFVYLMKRLLGLLPNYTDQLQQFIYKLQGFITRGADALVQPVIKLDGIGASLQRLFGKK